MALFSALFFCIAAADYLFDNKLGLANSFKEGLNTIVELMLVMTGFMVLTPWIAQHIAPMVSGFFQAIGSDPSLFAAVILAPDMGGAALSKEIALDPSAGLFNGMITSSFLGDMVCGGIPMALMKVKGTKKVAAVNGILIAFLVLPFGILLTGLFCGFSFIMMLKNIWPVVIISLLLLVLFRYLSNVMVPLFSGFSLLLRGISLFGFCLAILQETTGIIWIAGLTPISEILPIICNIGIFLGGILPFFSIIQMLLNKPIQKLCNKLHVQPKAISDIFVTTANHVPVLLSLNALEEKEIVFVVAYAMLSSFTVGDFLAFAIQFSPSIAIPMMFGRLITGFSSIILSVLFFRKIFFKKYNSQ
ncbi:MAG: ethanolamine utilization protein EutH [Lachnospiraceae bacterium]|nr:ethanolamine utilization protein EutH [Lachnospiraceae bacterium]